MTGRPAPTAPRPGRAAPAPSGHRPAADLPGLWVDLGDWHSKRRIWLRLPAARFTCRHGCVHEAFGAADVADFTARIATDHARTCPGTDATPK
ncbi:hypothetical protein AB0M23_32325 [Streptomyces sp. NPDC052077]|uniref:hypothetical protein n=1 Tax=Streptomyces sp. NPDC052077 TaxID=3154757 RepID=UPI00341BB75B